MNLREALGDALESMHRFPAPWCVAGGWAIDLFVGAQTRPHKDVDFAIFRDDQRAIHGHFKGWQIRKIVHGQFEDWPPNEWLELPVHEIHVRSRDRQVELLLNDRTEDKWVFRRDKRVTRPLESVIRTGVDGVPILAPVIVLLYKAKNPRPEDEHDFELVLKALREDDRRWLKDAIERVHPDHQWLQQL